MRSAFLVACYILSFAAELLGQQVFDRIGFRSGDSTIAVYPKGVQTFTEGKYLPIKIVEPNQQLVIQFIYNHDDEWASVVLDEHPSWQIISQPVRSDSVYTARIMITDAVGASFTMLRVRAYTDDSTVFKQEIPLFLHYIPIIQYERDMVDFYQEEEKTVELFVEIPYSVKADGRWITGKDYDYRLSYGVNSLLLQIRGHTLGVRRLVLPLKSTAPVWIGGQTLSYDLPPVEIVFQVKPNRLEFLNVDKPSIYFSQEFKYSEELLVDFSRNLALQRTYRIEDQQEGGGNLVAEMYTVSPVAGGKILCKLRTFGLHRMQNGYLYVKENDKTRFITNFNIIEKPRIDKVSIMPEGGQWASQLVVFPGQRLEAKVEGKGFDESTVSFDGVSQFRYDSLKSSAEVAFYTMQVPLSINKRTVEIFLNKKPSGHALTVREYQRPAEFHFVRVNYGDGYKPLSDESFDKPVFYERAVREINFSFDPSAIDKGERIYGKQYVQMEIRLLNARNVLLDIQTIQGLVVCPTENSVRGPFYARSDCKAAAIALNEYLRQKTFDLEPYAQILVTIKHDESKYPEGGALTRKLNIVLKRKLNFDVQFSFPAGLYLMQFRAGGEQINRLTGISTSVLAQLNFYDPNRIGRLRPYSVGVGFLGLNAFNFGTEDNRDLGIVLLGTVTPIRRDARFFVPLYFGGGYLIEAGTFFLVFGPGVQFRF